MIQSRQQSPCTVSPPVSVVFLLQVVHSDAAGVLHVDFGWVSLLQTHNPDTHYLTPYSCLNYRTTADNPPTVTRQIRPNIKGFPPGRSARSSLHTSGVACNNVLLYLTFVEFGGFSFFMSSTPAIRGLTTAPPPHHRLTSWCSPVPPS